MLTDVRFRQRSCPPLYPRQVLRLCQQGNARIWVLLNTDGSTQKGILTSSSGLTRLDRDPSVLNAVNDWNCATTEVNGEPIKA